MHIVYKKVIVIRLHTDGGDNEMTSVQPINIFYDVRYVFYDIRLISSRRASQTGRQWSKCSANAATAAGKPFAVVRGIIAPVPQDL